MPLSCLQSSIRNTNSLLNSNLYILSMTILLCIHRWWEIHCGSPIVRLVIRLAFLSLCHGLLLRCVSHCFNRVLFAVGMHWMLLSLTEKLLHRQTRCARHVTRKRLHLERHHGLMGQAVIIVQHLSVCSLLLSHSGGQGSLMLLCVL